MKRRWGEKDERRERKKSVYACVLTVGRSHHLTRGQGGDDTVRDGEIEIGRERQERDINGNMI